MPCVQEVEAAARKPSARREMSEVLIKKSMASESTESKREFDRSFSLFVGLPNAQHWES